MSDINMEISIPADDDGFILLQCSLCGEYFKLMANDIEADETIEIYCPYCGLNGNEYITMDVIELAQNIVENVAMDVISDEMKKWERNFKGKGFKFNAGHKPRPKLENPIISGIENLEVYNYKCCKKSAKIKPLTKFHGSYCPYCGVNYDGD